MNKKLNFLLTTVIAAGLLTIAGCTSNQGCPKAAADSKPVEAPRQTAAAAEPAPEAVKPVAEAAPEAVKPVAEAAPEAEPESPVQETPAVANEALIGDWAVVKLAGAAGIMDSVKTPHINFRDATRISGNSGINTIGGEYKTAENNQIKFGRLISTRKAGLPEAMDFERLFNQAMQKTVSYKISGNNLFFYDDAGNEVMALQRQ